MAGVGVAPAKEAVQVLGLCGVAAVVGRRQAIGFSLLRPAGTCCGADPERPELVEGEDAVREVLQDVLVVVWLGVAIEVRAGGILPGLGALECDAAAWEESP